LGGAAHDGALVGRFGCDPSLNITSVTGDIVEKLDCLPSELEGYGWQPFVHPADVDVTRRMAVELQTGIAGRYDLRAQARCGEPVLHLRIRTFVVRSGLHVPEVYGVLNLRQVESRRTVVTASGRRF
jgi:hypothetical protein